MGDRDGRGCGVESLVLREAVASQGPSKVPSRVGRAIENRGDHMAKSLFFFDLGPHTEVLSNRIRTVVWPKLH